MDVKYDKILGSMREKDASVVFAGDASDLFSSIPSDSKTFTSNEIVSRLDALIKLYGDTGRIRYDTGTKHFYFEVKQPDSSWATKFEIGGSAYVDVVNFLKTVEPATDSIRKGSTAVYSKDTILPNGDTIDRPVIKTDKGGIFSLVVHKEGTDEVLFRREDGTLVHVPITFADDDGHKYEDIEKIHFKGGVAISKNKNELIVDVSGHHLDFTFVSVTNDLAIDASNAVTYNSHTLSMKESGTGIQAVTLPLISSLNGPFSLKIKNDRKDPNAKVYVQVSSPDTIGDTYYLSLSPGDSVLVSKPNEGEAWFVESIVRKDYIENRMDGGEI